MLRKSVRLLAGVGLAALFSLAHPSPAVAQAYLGGDLIPYAIMAGTTVTCAGASTITGEVGVSPGAALVGFGGAPCTSGTLRTPPASNAGRDALVTAYLFQDGLSCSSTIGPDLAGLTLTPGVYCVGAAATNLSGTLTLNAQSNPNASWTFQMSSTLITSPNSTVSFLGGVGNACAVQWQVDSSASLFDNTTFVGNILALTDISMTAGANLTGRALARNGQVTLIGNNIRFDLCGAGGGIGGVPTLATWAVIVLIGLLALAGFATLRRRQSLTGQPGL